MPERRVSLKCSKSAERIGSKVRGQTFSDRHPVRQDGFPLTGSRLTIAKAMLGLSCLMNANDDAIDDLLNMIENWEEVTGRPFYTNQYVLAETRAGESPEKAARLAVDRANELLDMHGTDRLLIKRAEAIIKERALQFRDMPPDLNSDEFVRIMLVLLIEASSGKGVRLTSIGYAIDRPQTSVMRYIQQLEEHGLISRGGLPSDGRVTLIKLTEKGDKLARVLVGRAIETNTP